MPTMPIRQEPPLADDDIVVRGGILAFDSLKNAAEVCQARFGIHGISVCASPGESLEVLRTSGPVVKYTQHRVTTAGHLRALGFRLIPTGRSPHYTLDLGRPLDEDLWEELLEVFR